MPAIACATAGLTVEESDSSLLPSTRDLPIKYHIQISLLNEFTKNISLHQSKIVLGAIPNENWASLKYQLIPERP